MWIMYFQVYIRKYLHYRRRQLEFKAPGEYHNHMQAGLITFFGLKQSSDSCQSCMQWSWKNFYRDLPNTYYSFHICEQKQESERNREKS